MNQAGARSIDGHLGMNIRAICRVGAGNHYLARALSMTIAPPGLGKSTLAIAECVAMATGRDLLGVPIGKPAYLRRGNSWRPLRGFADLEPTRVSLVLRDCTLHEKNGKEWVGFPARSFQGEDGTTRWAPLVEFVAGATAARQQFQQQAIEAIHAAVAESQEPAR
jgi:hypothetical protein